MKTTDIETTYTEDEKKSKLRGKNLSWLVANFAATLTGATSAMMLALALALAGNEAQANGQIMYGCVDAACTCPGAGCPGCSGGCTCNRGICVST